MRIATPRSSFRTMSWFLVKKESETNYLEERLSLYDYFRVPHFEYEYTKNYTTTYYIFVMHYLVTFTPNLRIDIEPEYEFKEVESDLVKKMLIPTENYAKKRMIQDLSLSLYKEFNVMF